MKRSEIRKAIMKRKMFIQIDDDKLIFRYLEENYFDIEELLDEIEKNGIKEGDEVEFYERIGECSRAMRKGAVIFIKNSPAGKKS